MRKVIFDTDPGVDDALALLYLARHPGIDLVGVTTVFGNAPVEMTTRNALFLCERWGIEAPVHAGAGRPLSPTRRFGDFPTGIHGANGLGDVDLGEPARRGAGEAPAHRFLVEALRRHPGEISIVAVGRLTNLALALEEAPEIAGLAREVVVMGGAFLAPGNITPAAEANIFGDPEAADRVFAAGWPVTAVGLDVTREVVMTRTALEALAAEGGADEALLRDLSLGYIRFYSAQVADAMLVHDATACVALTDPELFRTVSGRVRVAGEGVATGATILAPDAIPFPAGDWDPLPSQRVCAGVDGEAVLSRIGEVLRAGRRRG